MKQGPLTKAAMGVAAAAAGTLTLWNNARQQPIDKIKPRQSNANDIHPTGVPNWARPW